MPVEIRTAVSMCLTAGMAVMAVLNLLDESRMSAPVAVLAYWGLWMALPCVLHALQVRAWTRQPNGLGYALLSLTLLAQVLLLLSYTHYAMNGDTAGRAGAEAMHLVLVPILSIGLAAFLFGVCLIGARVLAARARP